MKKIIKGVIPAAGFGTRMRSLSQNIPKEMLPICKKPIIEYAIKDMIKSDIREIAIITHPEKTIMNDYISDFENDNYGSVLLSTQSVRKKKEDARNKVENIKNLKKLKLFF